MQTLLQGDAFALPKIFEYLVDEQSVHAENFRLVCKQFYNISKQYQGAPYERVYNFGEHRFFVDRILKHENYVHSIKKDFFNAPETALRLLDKFAPQVEKLTIENAAEAPLNSNWKFDKLKHLKLRIFVKDNPSSLIQKWLNAAPNLQQLELTFKLAKTIVYKIPIEVYNVVKHVPKVDLVLPRLDWETVQPFSSLLSRVDFDNNGESELFQFLEKCTKLEQLRVRYGTNMIIPSMKYLTHLYLDQFSVNEVEFFRSLPQSLKKLVLDDSELTQFPAIEALTNLKVLSCNFKAAKIDIPEWFSKLPKLKHCDLDCSNVESQPVLIALPLSARTAMLHNFTIAKCFSCNKISDLQLHGCTIESFSSLFGKTNQVTRFDLDLCILNDEVQFDVMPHLLHVVLSGHSVTNNSLLQLSNVTAIFLDYCKLTEFPAAAAQLPMLRTLFLNSNQIKTVPDSVWNPLPGEFPQLVQLSMLNNPLSKYPKYIGMPLLENLQIPLLKFEISTDTIAPANIDRAEWTALVLQHMKYANERYIIKEKLVGHHSINQALIAYAISLANDRVMLNCHFEGMVTIFSYNFSLQHEYDSFVMCMVANAKTRTISRVHTSANECLFHW